MTVNQNAVIRKLAAIVIADVVGFSRHMERDDAGTLVRLKTIREHLIDPKIAAYGGHVVKTAGDGMLVEFASADAALRCAIDVQRAMRADNHSKPKDERIEFRIGINLGDIIVDGNDIAGDGVNVAARLEAMAEPGGICVSATVREQVHGGLDVRFDDIGEQQVKNIVRPIRVFAVDLNAMNNHGTGVGIATGASSRAGDPASSTRRPWPTTMNIATVAAAGVLALVATGASYLWWNLRNTTLQSPPAMSVGVLPFASPAEDAAAAQRAEALTREMTAMLTRTNAAIRVVSIPAMPTTMEYRAAIGATARMLNVRYLVEGVVQPRQGSSSISLRLLSGSTSEEIWSETVSVYEADSAHEQRRVVRTAANRLADSLQNIEIRRALAQPLNDATPMEYVLRAISLSETEPQTLRRAREQEKLFEEALARDPNLVPALNGLLLALSDELDSNNNLDRDRTVRRMDVITSKAVNLNGLAPESWAARARALMLMGQWDASLEAIAKAIRLDPESSFLLSQRAFLTILSGRPAEALAIDQQAVAMDPPGGWAVMMNECFAHILLGQFDRAIVDCEKAKGLSVEDWTVHVFLAAAYAQLGDTAKAAAARTEVLRLVPGYTIATFRSKDYSVNPEFIRLCQQHLFPELSKAGFPEH